MNSSLPDAVTFLSLLSRPGDVFELRALSKVNGQQHINSGYFDDVQALADAAVACSGKHDGVYVTLNPTNPALLCRREKNRISRVGGGDTTSDRDVRTRRSILIDVDPVRPAGISSSDEEHAAALELAWEIAADLGDAGWPEPILADSGNGAHLIYAVDLPVDDGGLVQRILARLSKRYSTPDLKVDEKVYNAARISKIYGTLTRKGINAPERPWRVARILQAPEVLEIVPTATLETLAPVESKQLRDLKSAGERLYPKFDLDAWIGRHLPDAIPSSWSEGRKWLLPVCPFNDQHDRKEAYITEKHSGTIAAGCQHDSCFSSWKELRERFEPDAYTRKSNGHRITDREPLPPEVLYEYQGELDAFADRDREPLTIVDPKPAREPWWRGPQLTDEIWKRKDDPWVDLKLGTESLCRIRAGGIVAVIGGSGSGKSSLVSNLLIEHAKNVGPAIALSIELPADELAARIVGIKCDSSWEDVLRGQLRYEFVRDALAVPRLYVLDRKNATLDNLRRCADAARKEYPNEPLLCAIDYAQLIQSREREARMRVNDAFERIDDVSREKSLVTIAVSQMGRAGAKLARDGERIGADAADLGAESAAIERFATVTLTIGMKCEPCEDSSQKVELSLGKGRMSGGDVVFPMRYWGKSGKWRLDGDGKRAADVRNERDVEKEKRQADTLEHALLGVASKATGPLSRTELAMAVPGNDKKKFAAIARLIAGSHLVEVDKYALRSRSPMVWILDRVTATPGLRLVSDSQDDDR